MKLSLGPVLFYWTREKLLNFYAEMLEQPLDVIYLGETVCSKRRAFGLDEWLGLARDLRGSTTAELVISGLALVEAASELSSLRRLCDNGELLVGRVISPSRSRALLGGVSVPVVKASEVVTAWATIHGQSEQVRLGTPERQREVLERMIEGKSNKAICRELDLSEATVKTHVQAIFRKLDVCNRTQAVLAAVRGVDSAIPVVAVSARGEMDAGDFSARGFAGCLRKPFTANELVAVLNTVCGADAAVAPVGCGVAAAGAEQADGVDFSALTAYAGDDTAAARGILESFAEQGAANCALLERALDEGDTAALKAVAHKMTPIFTMLGAVQVAAALRTAESWEGPLTDTLCREVRTAAENIRAIIAEAQKKVSLS